jgi:AcrR family transcriptional regulator
MNQVSTQGRVPKTERGRQTRDKLLEAAEIEFGEKGFHAAGISGITVRAGVALGTFYTYFESKEEIFEALVSFMNHRVRRWISERIEDAPDRMAAERLGFAAYIEFTRQHKGIYRIISEAEFVANRAFRDHYDSIARAYQAGLREAGKSGEVREGDYEAWSWAIMGIALMLGMRYAEWDESVPPQRIAELAGDFIEHGIGPGGVS